MKLALTTLGLVALLALPAAAHPCDGDATGRAGALLKLHLETSDLNFSIDDKVKSLKPIRALKGKGKLDVLEVLGFVNKATYRIRFVYARSPDSCVLMGQEILEEADPY